METTNYVSKMFMESLKKLIFAHPVFSFFYFNTGKLYE